MNSFMVASILSFIIVLIRYDDYETKLNKRKTR